MESVKNKAEAELNVWEKIRVIAGEGRDAGVYEARIQDLLNGGVVITEPVFVSGHTLLREGVYVVIQITRQDAAYEFHSRIHTQRTGKSKRVILTPPRRFDRVQRRMFARVELATGVAYAELVTGLDWLDWEQNVAWHKTLSVNISGGGILVRLPEPVKPGRVVAMRIDLFSEAQLPVDVVAVCRRTFKSEERRFGGFEYLLKDDLSRHFRASDLSRMPRALKSFSRQAQDRLVTLVFSKQIEQRRRGLL